MNRVFDRSGVTLIEAITTVTVIVIGVAGMLHAFSYGQYNIERAGTRQQALLLVEKELERWYAAARANPEHLPEPSRTTVVLNENPQHQATIHAHVSEVRLDRSIPYSLVTVSCYYGSNEHPDTVSLDLRVYRP